MSQSKGEVLLSKIDELELSNSTLTKTVSTLCGEVKFLKDEVSKLADQLSKLNVQEKKNSGCKFLNFNLFIF
jgi:hypothetical protein